MLLEINVVAERIITSGIFNIAKIENIEDMKINDEGVKPVWLTLDEALKKELVYPVRYFIEKYGEKLSKSVS